MQPAINPIVSKKQKIFKNIFCCSDRIIFVPVNAVVVSDKKNKFSVVFLNLVFCVFLTVIYT